MTTKNRSYFTTNEICHVWAHQSAPFGNSPSALSFNGDTLLSYNTAIARLIEHKGKKAVIINDRSFSISTSKHQGKMRQALPPDLQRFYIAEDRGARLTFSGPGPDLFAYAVEQAAANHAWAEKTRKGTMKRDGFEAAQVQWLERAKEVSAFFGLKRKVDEKTIARLSASKVKEEKRVKRERDAREKAQRVEFQANYEKWKQGEQGAGYFPASAFPTAFRLEGEEVVSTQGARVPLLDAWVAYRFITSKRGQEWRENGVTCPVGNYRINSISEVGIIAGCHRITWAEVERLADLLA